MKFPVTNHKLFECGLCGNPHPYMCHECNGELAMSDYQQSEPQQQQSAQQDQPVGLIYIGSGEDFPTDVHCGDCC